MSQMKLHFIEKVLNLKKMNLKKDFEIKRNSAEKSVSRNVIQ